MVNWSNIWDIFTFDKNSPLLFTSGKFLFLFILFYSILLFFKNRRSARIVYLTLFSIFFYYKTSGLYLLILLFMSVSDYIIANRIQSQSDRNIKKSLLVLSIVVDAGILCHFKYTNFIEQIISDLVNKPFEVENLFVPVGISFFVFQSISYVYDIYKGVGVKAERYIDYLFFLSYFPHILAGPIVRAKDFIPQMKKEELSITKEEYNTAFLLIIIGLFKKAIISDYISLNLVDRIMDDPIMFTGFENLIGVYGYTLQIYFDFSGYSDLAIGISLLIGYRLPINFERPYLSATPTEFWRRWHITLSLWLRDYLYIPLGGNRKGKARQYFNLMTTMLIGGLWHGAAVRFIVWGAWHGMGLCIHKLMAQINPSIKMFRNEMSKVKGTIATIVTFHFVCLGWILFRVDSFEKAWNVIRIIFTSFNWNLIPEIISAYHIQISLLLLGYILVFLPGKYHSLIFGWIKESSMPVKIAILVLVLWVILQVKSSEIQPFIYFQF